MSANFKLQIDLVPEPLWNKNLRDEKWGLGRTRWDKLRKQILEANGPACAICGIVKEPQGHEVWEYDEQVKPCVARLVKIEIICKPCHMIMHWSRTNQFSPPETLAFLREHFCAVNKCQQSDFDAHVKQSNAIYQTRSRKEWKIDWGEFVGAMAAAVVAREARGTRER